MENFAGSHVPWAANMDVVACIVIFNPNFDHVKTSSTLI